MPGHVVIDASNIGYYEESVQRFKNAVCSQYQYCEQCPKAMVKAGENWCALSHMEMKIAEHKIEEVVTPSYQGHKSRFINVQT